MTQPTALFLADILEDAGKPADIAEKAAAELRRLYDLAMEQQGKIYALEMARSMEQKTAKLKRDALAEPVQEPVQEPVAWMNTEDGFCTLDSPVEGIDVMSQWVPLYGSPPQRKPLTEEEVYSLFRTVASPVMFARAIERAHDIT